MLAITQPSASGTTAQVDSASSHGDQRRQQEDRLVGAGRNDRLLEDELQKVGEGLEKTPRTHHVRTTAQLHGCPDLAVGQQDVGDEDEQADEEQQRLTDHDERQARHRSKRTIP